MEALYRLVDQDGLVYCVGTLSRCRSEYSSVFRMAVCFGVLGLRLRIEEVI